MNKRQSVGDAGPLSLYVGGFREYLERKGYATDSVRWRLRQLTALDRWLRDHHLAADDLGAECVDRLVAARRAEGRTTLVAVSNFSVPIGYLREIGVGWLLSPREWCTTGARSGRGAVTCGGHRLILQKTAPMLRGPADHDVTPPKCKSRLPRLGSLKGKD